MKNNIYEYFDINKKASQDEIKKAFKKKAKKTHPDLNGNREEFEKANKYYKVLLNPNLRKRYDETGSIDENKKKSAPYYILITLFNGLLSAPGIDYKKHDLIDAMKYSLNENIKKKRDLIIDLKKEIDKFILISNKFSSTNKDNIFKNVLDEKIKYNKIQIEGHEIDIHNAGKALEILNDYSYEYENDIKIIFKRVGFIETSATAGF